MESDNYWNVYLKTPDPKDELIKQLQEKIQHLEAKVKKYKRLLKDSTPPIEKKMNSQTCLKREIC